MSGVNEILQNLDKRVGALETADLEDSAVLTQIAKLYADFEIEVRWKAYLHRYHRCGESVESVANMNVNNREYTLFCSPDLYL